MKYYVQYKGIWYMYKPQSNRWFLSDDENGKNNLMVFNGSTYRIDECFDEWFKVMDKE